MKNLSNEFIVVYQCILFNYIFVLLNKENLQIMEKLAVPILLLFGGSTVQATKLLNSHPPPPPPLSLSPSPPLSLSVCQSVSLSVSQKVGRCVVVKEAGGDRMEKNGTM